MAGKEVKDKKDDEIVVFIIRRDTECSRCGAELSGGAFLRVENNKALCLSCAGMDHLHFLPRGDPAVTRRAAKYSSLKVVVVQWARARKRYERQGILAEAEAIERAKQESSADAQVPAAQSRRAME